MTPRQQGQRRLRLIATALGGGFHAIQVLVFWAMDLWGLGWVSVASVAWFTVCAWAVRAGRGREAMIAVWFEVTVHSLFLTTMLGVDTGYLLYSLAIACGTFLVFDPTETRERYGLTAVSALLFVTFLIIRTGESAILALSATNQLTLLALNGLGTALALIGCVAYFANASAVAEAEADRQRERSEKLLRNVLPDPIAERLKDQPGTVADHFESVTVLFADLAGFTKLSAGLSTTEVLDMLNTLFSAFDGLAAKHGLEKIKTIGDAYMVVGGVPEPLDDHTAAVARFALDLREVVASYAQSGGHAIDVRIGIHTGPVVAGVIGVDKFAYDLWGDTVNTASRMESHGAVGRIHVSDDVRAALGELFAFEDRGEIEVKSKGPMRTWFLLTDLSVDQVAQGGEGADEGHHEHPGPDVQAPLAGVSDEEGA